MINKESIVKMKKGVKINNTARGELNETEALIEGWKSKQIGAAWLEVLESEKGIFQSAHRISVVDNDQIAIIKALNNVVLTNHFAFFTDQAVEDMVYCGLNSLSLFIKTDTTDFKLNKFVLKKKIFFSFVYHCKGDFYFHWESKFFNEEIPLLLT